ncbi:MAG: TetR/AcrR family transcriptional regulator [Pseudomonadota bacterium]
MFSERKGLMPLETLDDTAKQILSAASRRFLHYGFRKTTMSEIAEDCNMSTGNLYRYFPSKMDIAETFVRVLRRETSDALRAIADDENLPSEEKLRRFFRHKLKVAYDRFHDNQKAYELSQELIAERPKFAVEWERHEGTILADILAKAEERGDFLIGGAPSAIARILQDAAYRFTGPGVIHEGELDFLKQELDGVLDLILDAFACRTQQKHART